MSERIGFSVGGQATAIQASDGLVWFQVGELRDTDKRSGPVPARCKLLALHVQLSAVDGAASVTAQLAPTSAGARPLSNRALAAASQAISFNRSGNTTSTTDGAVLHPLAEWPYVRKSGDEVGVLYVGLELDAGEAVPTLITLYWQREGAES